MEGESLCTPHLQGVRMVEQAHVHHCLKVASYVPECPALIQFDGEHLCEKVASATHCQLARGLDSA